jgi:hypothetical protein
MRCRVLWKLVTDVSYETAASSFRVDVRSRIPEDCLQEIRRFLLFNHTIFARCNGRKLNNRTLPEMRVIKCSFFNF